MPELVRVKLPNGVEKTLPKNHPAVTAEGVEILDKPAVDPVTRALVPDKARVDLRTPTGPYQGMGRADLLAEITRRNDGRDEADLIPATGNKPALVAALTADDANHPAS
jgi:hypothetical protein